MKRVTIPTVMSPWECIIDGVKYTYPAGKTMDVPDQVAELIAFYNKSQQEEIPESETKKLEKQIRSIARYEAGNVVNKYGATEDFTLFKFQGESRNSVFRGMFLGNGISDEQKKAIREGTFDNMYVGDYWGDADAKYIIAGFNCVKTQQKENHIAIFARWYGKGSYMHLPSSGSDTPDVPFLATTMATKTLPESLGIFEKKFGAAGMSTMVFTVRDERQQYGVTTYGHKITLPSQQQVFGTDILQQYPSINDGYNTPIFYENQLPFFQYPPDCTKYNFGQYDQIWLRDKVRAINGFTVLNIYDRYIVPSSGNTSNLVWPIFCINGK